MEALKAGAVLGGIFGFILVFFLACLLVGGFFLWIGARLAKIRKAGFLWCVVVSLLCGVAGTFVSGVLSVVPLIGTLLGILASIAVSVMIIQAMFETTLEKACLCWLFHFIAVWISLFVAAIVTAGGLTAAAVIFGR